MLEDGALVLATKAAASRLRAAVPASAEVVVCRDDGGAVDLADALALLRERGHRLVLSEGGPCLFASLLVARLVDELFLTVSSFVAGRATVPRPGIAEGVELLPEHRVEGALRSVRRSGAHLFLHYALR